jgi:hypothetical protein
LLPAKSKNRPPAVAVKAEPKARAPELPGLIARVFEPSLSVSAQPVMLPVEITPSVPSVEMEPVTPPAPTAKLTL